MYAGISRLVLRNCSQPEKTDSGMCARCIDVSDEYLPVCLGDEVVGGEGGSGLSDQYLRIFLPCTAQQNIPRMIV